MGMKKENCRNEQLLKIINKVKYDLKSLNYIDDDFKQSKEILKNFLENNIYDININNDELLICNNISNLVIDLIKHFENETDLFLIENPCFHLFNDILKDKETQIIETNDDGIDLKSLERILSANKKIRILLIIVPYHQNPTCINDSKEKKEAILKLSNQYNNLTIISDEVYSFLSIYDKKNSLDLPLFFMDKKENSNIISVNSLSKSLIP